MTAFEITKLKLDEILKKYELSYHLNIRDIICKLHTSAKSNGTIYKNGCYYYNHRGLNFYEALLAIDLYDRALKELGISPTINFYMPTSSFGSGVYKQAMTITEKENEHSLLC